MNIKDLIENVEINNQTVFHLEAALGADGGDKLIVEQRQLLPEAPRQPVRAESQARAHTFHTAVALADYLRVYGGEASVVFVDVANERMTASIDEKAQHGIERLDMAPIVHPLWRPWSERLGRKMPISDLALLLRTYRRNVENGKELAIKLSQVSADVKVTIQRGQGKGAVNGIVVAAKIQGVEQGIPVELPETIRLTVPLYVGTAQRLLELDLLIDADRDGNVWATLTPGNVIEERVKAFEEMAAAIEKIEKGTVVHGVDARRAWDVLREQTPIAR